MRETLVQFPVRKICWRRDRLPIPVFLGFPCGSAGKESACTVGDLDSISGLGRSSGEGKGYPLQYSVLENSMDCIVHEVSKSWTWLSNFHFHFKCPQTEEWRKKMWFIYTQEYYSAITKNEIMPFAATCMDLASVILSEISQTEKEKYCMTSLICGI